MCLSSLYNSGLSIVLYLQDPEEFKCGWISSLEVKVEFVEFSFKQYSAKI